MNRVIKPYRLINTHEIALIQSIIEKKLGVWNTEYARMPLSCHILRPMVSSIFQDTNLCLIENDTVHAVLVQQDWSAIKMCLFGDEDSCFDVLSINVFLKLVNQLMNTNSMQIEPALSHHEDDAWFYAGSPCLMLRFSVLDKSINMYLNPQWVLNALPSHAYRTNIPLTLSDALALQNVNLAVELSPACLKLSDVMRLKVGDVIQTDHNIATQVHLTQGSKVLCCAEIGHKQDYKSIQITRTL